VISEGRRGFTLVEVLAVSTLMAFLAVLVSAAWSTLGRPTVDMIARGRIAQEANLAAASFCRDLAGSLADAGGRLGTKVQGRYVGRLIPGGTQLWLCFDGGPSPNGLADWGPPDAVIVYEVIANQLIRSDQSTNTSYVVAQYVSAMQVQDLGDRVEIQLTFTYRNVTQTYSVIARNA
jgi:prepilin-type N-terminal cleavage/methylation domain-containing protein